MDEGVLKFPHHQCFRGKKKQESERFSTGFVGDLERLSRIDKLE